jgi:hypothetical protein
MRKGKRKTEEITLSIMAMDEGGACPNLAALFCIHA